MVKEVTDATFEQDWKEVLDGDLLEIVSSPYGGVNLRWNDVWAAHRCLLALMEHGVRPGEGLVLLAGYMKILPRSFVDLYEGRIMNIHPSLLPAFPGRDAQRQALAYGAKVAGCTVHFVAPEVDAGPIIIQKAVEVREDDDEDSLASRILRQEHRIYPQAVALFAEGRLRIRGRRVLVSR